MKKSQSENFWLVIVIITVAVGLVIVSIVLPIVRKIRTSSDTEACRLSVLASSAVKQITQGTKSVTLKCPRNKIEFERETQNEIFKKINQEMISCIYKMGEGNIDFTKENKIWAQKNCLICSQFSFKGEAKNEIKKGKLKYPIYNWSRTTEYKSGQNYWAYLNSFNQDYIAGKGLLTILPPLEINPDKSYMVIFKRYDDSLFTKYINVIKSYTGVEWGFETKSLTWKSTKEFAGVEFQEINEQQILDCDNILN